MKRFWPSWRSFKTNWINEAAKRTARDIAADEREKERLKLKAPIAAVKESAGSPVVARIEPEFPPVRPTRAEVLENFPHVRGPRY